MYNLLTDPLIRATNINGRIVELSLPDVFAALARDEISSFPALRPHQQPAWHMFLCQLGALALHGAVQLELPDNAGDWCRLIRNLTPKFPDDEPWQLVVADRQKPAFMQPPEEEGGNYTGIAETPDALDMLVTSKNHDLKQAVAREAGLDEWIFALISLQTGEGFNGAGNYGIARMNGGSSSRVCMGLVPASQGHAAVLPGARFKWDTAKLLRDRSAQIRKNLELEYQPDNALSLVWAVPWPDGEQLQINQLDFWFIEICRRIRLQMSSGKLEAQTGTTKATRINAKALNGVCGDGWAPLNLKDKRPKSLTLGERDFDYRLMSDMLFGPNWQLPPMLQLSKQETERASGWLLIAQAIGRGKSKTYGYFERLLPISMKVATIFSLEPQRERLGDISKQQINDISKFSEALKCAVGIFTRGGVEWKDLTKEQQNIARDKQKKASNPYRDRLDKFADELFFPALWKRFEATQNEDGHKAQDAARLDFLLKLHKAALALLEEAVGSLPCPAIYRHRARIRAMSKYHGMIRSEKAGFSALREYFENRRKEVAHDAD